MLQAAWASSLTPLGEVLADCTLTAHAMLCILELALWLVYQGCMIARIHVLGEVVVPKACLLKMSGVTSPASRECLDFYSLRLI